MTLPSKVSVATQDLPRKLSLLDAISIGEGVFLVPNLVLRKMQSLPLTLGVRILASHAKFAVCV